MGIVRGMAVVAAALALGSCIDFEGQNLSYRYDQASDTLRIFIVYEAIFTSGAEGKAAERPLARDEKNQLESVVRGRRAFFFGNWLTEFDGKGFERDIADLRKKLEKTDAPDQRAWMKSDLEMYEAVNKAIRVQNGRFYLDDRGRLCGWQYVTISNVSGIVSRINNFARRKFAEIAYEMGESAPQRLRDFAKKGECVRVDGNQVRIRFYRSYPKFVESRRNAIEKKEPFDIRTQDAVLNYDEPMVEVIFGRLGQKTTTLSRPAEGKSSEILIKYVKEKYGLVPMPDLEKLRATFIETGKIPEGGK
jgi:hypothetical protein